VLGAKCSALYGDQSIVISVSQCRNKLLSLTICQHWATEQSVSSMHFTLLGPFHGAIAVPSVARCRCCCRRRRGHRCAGGVRRRVRHLVNGNVAAARSGKWAQHFSNASRYTGSVLAVRADSPCPNSGAYCNIVMSVSVCMFVCLSARVYRKPHGGT